MAEENPKEEERKSARGRRAKKREDDILEPALEEEGTAIDASGSAEPEEATEAQAVEEPAAAEKTEEPAARAETAEPAEQEEEAEENEAKEPVEEEPEEVIEPLAAEEVILQGEAWLGELFEKMQLELKAEGQAEGDDFIFNISGPDAEALIGRSRQSPRVLAAMQTILTEKFGRRAPGRVEVDLGGFKQRRQERLATIAVKLGETARRLERPLTVAGLNNFERRIIHQELAEDRKLRTESTDQGIFRKLRILPK